MSRSEGIHDDGWCTAGLAMYDAAIILSAGNAVQEPLGLASSILGAPGQGREVSKARPLVPEGLDQLSVVQNTATPEGRRPIQADLNYIPRMDVHPSEVRLLGLQRIPGCLAARDGMPWDPIAGQHAADPDVVSVASAAKPGRYIPVGLMNVQGFPELGCEEAGPDHVAAHSRDDVHTGQLRQLVGMNNVAIGNSEPVNWLVQHFMAPAATREGGSCQNGLQGCFRACCSAGPTAKTCGC